MLNKQTKIYVQMKTKKRLVTSTTTLMLTIVSMFIMFQLVSLAVEKPKYGKGWFPVVAVGEGGSHWTECIETTPDDYCVPTEITGLDDL